MGAGRDGEGDLHSLPSKAKNPWHIPAPPKHGRTSVPSGGHAELGKTHSCSSPRKAEQAKGCSDPPGSQEGTRRRAGGSGGDSERILPTAPRSRTNMKCSSIGASKSAPAAGSGRGWRQLPCRAVGSAPPLPELQERGLIKKGGGKYGGTKNPQPTLFSLERR